MHIGFLFNKAKDSANMPNCLHNSQIRKYHANPLILQTQVQINLFTLTEPIIKYTEQSGNREIINLCRNEQIFRRTYLLTY